VSPPARRTPAADPRLNARLNECIALFQKGQADRALAGVRRVLEKAPANPAANQIASVVLLALNQPEQAAYHAERAAAAEPEQGRHHLALGMARLALNDESGALAAYETAFGLIPDDPEAIAGLGSACAAAGQYDRAETLLRRALELRPGWPDPVMALATQFTNTARAHEAVLLLRDLLARHPTHLPAADALALASSYDDASTPAEVFEDHRAFGRCAESIMRPVGAHLNTRDPDRRIRLAYLSAELRNHSNSYFLRPILEHRDRERFEIVLYHTSRHEDAVTDAIRSMADQYVKCERMTPPELARRIHRDRVDVLVELTGHFGRNRLAAMAARPAPVQVTYLGYGNTTGLTTIDARIIDAVTDPEGAESLATERLVRLDRCFLAFRPDDDAPEPEDPEPGRPFTFGSFNDIKKISPGVVRAWARALEACPGSRLLLKTPELGKPAMRDMLAARFAQAGVDPERVRMVGRIESDRGHLALYDAMDLALDTFPYAGTTTTCQALWQGVPVLTLAGRAHAGRVGLSLLEATGLREWAASDEDGYVRLAGAAFERGLRTRADRLALRERVRGSSLLDHAGHARALEAAYNSLWDAWCGKAGA
jgi:predicted O-linked N-acetylglucosamine transferase (SPINDLY family)